MLISYTVVPIMLEQSSAVVMNVSFLSSDFFSVIFAVGLFHATLYWLYFIAFICIIVGGLMYNLAEYGYTLTDMWTMVRTCQLKQPQDAYVEEGNDALPLRTSLILPSSIHLP